jgi:hypothetical protein
MKVKLNPSIEHHTLIALVLMIWAFIFGFFARPFEHGYMDLKIWLKVSSAFSVSIFICYFFISIVQNKVYKIYKSWSLFHEILIYILLFSTYTLLTYSIYKSSFIRGFYDIYDFLIKIIINIILIITPIIIIARKYTLKLISKKVEEHLTIKGDNKLDILKIKASSLVCISNAQNYVEIFYLEDNDLKTKLIRSSLKKMLNDYDFLIQVHRSHLINPYHFQSWKDSNTITLTKIELPVSKSYKNSLSNL